MIPDPATTPLKPARQALFGISVAMIYALTQVLHLVFGLFFALIAVCAIRGVSLHAWALWQKFRPDSMGGNPNLANTTENCGVLAKP
jgi:hypothetical protein